MRKEILILAVAMTIFSMQTALAQTGIEIKPQAPPGLGEQVIMILGWLYWLALVAMIGVIIWAAVGLFFMGRDTRAHLILSIVVLAFLVALPEILKAIGV